MILYTSSARRIRGDSFAAEKSWQVKRRQRLPAVPSELWYCICLAFQRQQSFYSIGFSCFTQLSFSTTEYCTVELAPAAKLTGYSLRPPKKRKGSHFSQDTPRHRVCNSLQHFRSDCCSWSSSVRAILSYNTLPNSNVRCEYLLREFSGTTLPERTTLAAKAKLCMG